MITLIIGPLCSGKDYLSNLLIQLRYSDIHIAVGDIVRAIAKKEERVHIKEYDRIINSELAKLIAAYKDRNIVISGMRQTSILHFMLQFVKWSDLEIVVIDAPYSILSERYRLRDDKKENSSFQKAFLADNELGVSDLMRYIRNDISTYIKTTFITTTEVKPKPEVYDSYFIQKIKEQENPSVDYRNHRQQVPNQ